MASPVSRRRFAQLSTAALVLASGCLDSGVGGQPESVPVEIENRSDQTHTLFVEFVESDTGDVFLSETSEIEPDATREFEVGPIDPQAQYTVAYGLGGDAEDDTVPGSGLRSVRIEITETGTVEMSYAMT
jgi:hypothetical protein